MTASSEARVPHDPRDLRDAVRLLRTRPPTWSGGMEQGRVELADRLEAWADDMERGLTVEQREVLAYEAGESGGVAGYTAVIEDALPDDIDADDPYAVAAYIAAPRRERLAPLEAAVLDAAKAWDEIVSVPDSITGEEAAAIEQLTDAVRALQDAT